MRFQRVINCVATQECSDWGSTPHPHSAFVLRPFLSAQIIYTSFSALKGVTAPSPDGDDMDDDEAPETAKIILQNNHDTAMAQVRTSDGFADANGNPHAHSSLPATLPPGASAAMIGQGVGGVTAAKADEVRAS